MAGAFKALLYSILEEISPRLAFLRRAEDAWDNEEYSRAADYYVQAASHSPEGFRRGTVYVGNWVRCWRNLILTDQRQASLVAFVNEAADHRLQGEQAVDELIMECLRTVPQYSNDLAFEALDGYYGETDSRLFRWLAAEPEIPSKAEHCLQVELFYSLARRKDQRAAVLFPFWWKWKAQNRSAYFPIEILNVAVAKPSCDNLLEVFVAHLLEHPWVDRKVLELLDRTGLKEHAFSSLLEHHRIDMDDVEDSLEKAGEVKWCAIFSLLNALSNPCYKTRFGLEKAAQRFEAAGLPEIAARIRTADLDEPFPDTDQTAGQIGA